MTKGELAYKFLQDQLEIAMSYVQVCGRAGITSALPYDIADAVELLSLPPNELDFGYAMGVWERLFNSCKQAYSDLDSYWYLQQCYEAIENNA